MIRLKLVLALTLLTCFAVGSSHTGFGGAEPVATRQLEWEKPVTDAQWAEDTKNEAIAYRSDKVIAQMIASHTAKLAREKKAVEKYLNCADCLYWEYREQFEAAGMSGYELTAEAHNAADAAFNQRQWSIAKLQQSIERMRKETELRAKGFVTTDDKSQKAGLFGASPSADRLRHIID